MYQYYRFDSGRYFRRNEETHLFDLLEADGQWKNSGWAAGKFYDVASEFSPVTEVEALNHARVLAQKAAALCAPQEQAPEDGEVRFRLTVVGGKQNPAGALDCRNGHAVGDRYECAYGCPGGFCQKSMLKAFPVMEAARAGGDLRLLGGSGRDCMDFCCPDGVVRFRLEVITK